MVQGTVDKPWRNERADGSEYCVLSIDRQRYTTFSRQLVKDIREGDRVEFVTADRLAVAPDWLRIVRMNCRWARYLGAEDSPRWPARQDKR